jgi:NAD(P)-dependent dehydrogenase (short-subunit alcohol dehydrogenase family)
MKVRIKAKCYYFQYPTKTISVMANKYVLITGAGGNLGKTVVTEFLKQGYHVMATVSPGKNLRVTHPHLTSYEINLTDEAAVGELMLKLSHQPLHAALLLAGGFQAGKLANTSGDELEKMIGLNFFTAWFMARAIFEKMVLQPDGGRIIMVGARPALYAPEAKHAVAYALSKSLVFKLAEILNAEGQSNHVITSVIVPGTIDTPANRHAMPDADFSKWVSPQSIAETMLFLCSRQSGSWREPVIKMFGGG